MAATQIERRNILIVGKTGAGKSTLCNQLLDNPADGKGFQVKDYHVDMEDVICHKECKFEVENTEYHLKIIDTMGFFDQKVSDKDIFKETKDYLQTHFSEGLNLIIYVFRKGRFTKEEEEAFKILETDSKDATTRFQKRVSEFTALVITNCEGGDDEDRQRFVNEFKVNKKSKPVAEFMNKGIYPVGFPDIEKMKPKLRDAYREDIEADRKKLKEVVISSSERILCKDMFSAEPGSYCTIL